MLEKIKKYYKIKIRKFLKFTAQFRHNPDFIIIGTQKGGTTSLFHYLSQHPQLNLPSTKEIHFFTKKYQYGLNFYKTYFPFKQKGKLSGEATPYYLYHPLVPERMFNHFPKIKLIVMLRNPVDRAFSQYNMEKKLSNEDRSFKTAIKDELKQFKDWNKDILKSKNHNAQHAYHSYLTRGLYKEQVERWLKYYKKEQMLFIKSEDFFKDPENELHKVFSFLKIEKVNIKDLKPKLQGNYTQLDDAFYTQLAKFFNYRNNKLTNVIGDNFKWL
jgi:hypothetical protein